MSTKFKHLRDDIEDLEQSDQYDVEGGSTSKNGSSSSKMANYILLIAFLTTLIFYTGSRIDFSDVNVSPDQIENFVQGFNQPSDELLNGMGTWMEEMGYGELSREELIELRNEGVTATFTSQIREVGYTDVTLDELVALKNAGVSATYTRMMKELGYELTIQDLIDLRREGVTAHFTSNMMDLGYTIDDLTKGNLIRLRSVGVTHGLAERLLEENGVLATIEELIRYRISNQ